LTTSSSISRYSPKITNFLKISIPHISERLGFETPIMFVVVGQINVLKMNDGHWLPAFIFRHIWVIKNEAFYSSFSFLFVSGSFLMTV
jgi:hypothetical protein